MPLPDKIPDWVKKGSVTLRNYELRAFWFGRDIKSWGDSWPLLSRNPDEAEGTADELAWELSAPHSADDCACAFMTIVANARQTKRVTVPGNFITLRSPI
jgi:hypothetical protein